MSSKQEISVSDRAVSIRVQQLNTLLDFVMPKDERDVDKALLTHLYDTILLVADPFKKAKLLESYTKIRKMHIDAPGKLVDKAMDMLNKIKEAEMGVKKADYEDKIREISTQKQLERAAEEAKRLGEVPPEL